MFRKRYGKEGVEKATRDLWKDPNGPREMTFTDYLRSERVIQRSIAMEDAESNSSPGDTRTMTPTPPAVRSSRMGPGDIRWLVASLAGGVASRPATARSSQRGPTGRLLTKQELDRFSYRRRRSLAPSRTGVVTLNVGVSTPHGGVSTPLETEGSRTPNDGDVGGRQYTDKMARKITVVAAVPAPPPAALRSSTTSGSLASPASLRGRRRLPAAAQLLRLQNEDLARRQEGNVHLQQRRSGTPRTPLRPLSPCVQIRT